MSAKKYVVVLDEEARQSLERAARSHKRSVRERQRARILLAAARGADDASIAQAAGIHRNTVAGVRRRFVTAGVKRVRRAEQKQRQARRLDGRAEAHLVALTCSAPPEDRKRWSLHLRAGKLVEAQVVDTLSHETGCQTLKKISSSRGQRRAGASRPGPTLKFVACMEDVRAVYHRPHDPARPLVCFDEAARQLLAEVRAPLPMRPGCSERVDGEYTRHGTAWLFRVCEPLAGRRHVFGRERRTRVDLAAVIKTLCDELYPKAEKIVRVLDQLNTHGPGSLYAAFPPTEARRLARAAGNSPHAQARLLVKYGRDRTQRPGPPVLGRTHGKPAAFNPRRCRLGTNPQRRHRAHRRAFYHHRCPHQTQAPLPTTSTLKEH